MVLLFKHPDLRCCNRRHHNLFKSSHSTSASKCSTKTNSNGLDWYHFLTWIGHLYSYSFTSTYIYEKDCSTLTYHQTSYDFFQQDAGIKSAWNSGRIIGLLIGFVLLFIAFVGAQIFMGDEASIPKRIFLQRNIFFSAVS